MSYYYKKKKRLPKRSFSIDTYENETDLLSKNAKKLFSGLKNKLITNKNNCNIICWGPTGSGKSSLAMSVGKTYLQGEEVSADLFAFDFGDFVKLTNDHKSTRGGFAVYDEGNLSKRRSMSTTNTDFIDLFFTFRSKSLFTWINNPSANILDKELIGGEEIDYFVCIINPRKHFVVFKRENLKELYEFTNDLSVNTIAKYWKNFKGNLCSWRHYNGPEVKAYEAKKDKRIDDKIQSLMNKYDVNEENEEATYSSAYLQKYCGVGKTTIQRRIKELEELVPEVIARFKNPLGLWNIPESELKNFKKYVLRESDHTVFLENAESDKHDGSWGPHINISREGNRHGIVEEEEE